MYQSSSRSTTMQFNTAGNPGQETTAAGYGTHLRRHQQDPAWDLCTYPCFYDDKDSKSGEVLLTSLRSTRQFPRGTSLLGTAKAQDFATSRRRQGVPAALGGSLDASTYTKSADSGVMYMYQTGPYTSKSGLPPLAYKPWQTEYNEEYRSPTDRKETLKALTVRHGTGDALKTTRYQHQGYPPSFQLLESSLTKRGQKAPQYESRVTAF